MKQPIRIKHRLAMILAVVGLGIGVGFFLMIGNAGDESAENVSRHEKIAKFPVFSAIHGESTERSKAGVIERLDGFMLDLKSASSAADSVEILDRMRAYLESLPSGLASAAISEFLADSRRDAKTHMRFSIGDKGQLAGCPTLRLALLDWIGRTSPKDARLLAESILSSPEDADEWAVRLRNYCRAGVDSGGREFLRKKTEELICSPAWRENPSIGYFQAFDVLVHVRATDSAGLLADLVSDKTPEGAATAHAAFLVLDRLTFRETSKMLEQLVSRRGLWQPRGEMVANLMAKADLSDSDQERLVGIYLSDPERTKSEIRAFTGVYPNANFAISRNLLTGNSVLNRNEIIDRAAHGIEAVDRWLAKPEFFDLSTELYELRERLEKLVDQAGPRESQ